MIEMRERTNRARLRSLRSLLMPTLWLLLPAAFPVMVTGTMSQNFQCHEYATPTERIEIDKKEGNLVEIHIRQNVEVSACHQLHFLMLCQRKTKLQLTRISLIMLPFIHVKK